MDAVEAKNEGINSMEVGLRFQYYFCYCRYILKSNQDSAKTKQNRKKSKEKLKKPKSLI